MKPNEELVYKLSDAKEVLETRDKDGKLLHLTPVCWLPINAKELTDQKMDIQRQYDEANVKLDEQIDENNRLMGIIEGLKKGRK